MKSKELIRIVLNKLIADAEKQHIDIIMDPAKKAEMATLAWVLGRVPAELTRLVPDIKTWMPSGRH